ncbi:MAG: Ig-like domain-containing protein [Candidatus Bipolaricaulaceae bacterium]
MKMWIVLLAVSFATVGWAAPDALVFVLDASNSMNQRMEGTATKFDWAKEALTTVIEELPAEVPFAVVAFGHRVHRERVEESCLDIELVGGFGARDPAERQELLVRIADLQAMGKTPLAEALAFAAEVAPPPWRLVLLTDGEETCGGDPLAVARAICGPGQVMDVVAVGVTPQVSALLGSLARTCGGRFVSVRDPAELPELFREVALPAAPTPQIPEAYRGYEVDHVIWGTEGDDVLFGTAERDLIFGLGGDDLIIGLGGDDVLVGGEGHDILQGGAGNDRLEGGPGNDRLLGGPGDDTLLGEAGDDVLEGEAGSDVLLGHAGDDKLLGGPGCDQLDGGPGCNFLYDEGVPPATCAPTPPPPVQPPTCIAPQDIKSVDEGASIVLRADAYDPDGDPLTIGWWADKGTFSDPHRGETTYHAPLVSACEGEDVRIQVTVTDACGASDTDTLILHVRNVNHPPVADAGPDVVVEEGGTVQLTCTATDPDGDQLFYMWSVPCGRGRFDDLHALHPRFTAPSTDRCEGEDIVLTFTVRDACGAQASDTLVVHVRNDNRAPWVDAGPDLEVAECDRISVSAKAGDPDGQPLSVSWTASSGSLIGADGLCPTFVAPAVSGCTPTEVILTVRVTDPCGATVTDSLVVRVHNVNRPPTVHADP